MSIEQIFEESSNSILNSPAAFQEERQELFETQETPTRNERTSRDTARKVRAENAFQVAEGQWRFVPLTPERQEAAEKAAILADSRLKERIQGEEVLSIEKVEEGRYLIKTETYEVEATVQNLPMKYCGVPEFEINIL